jgi:hypothetical protein
MLVSDTEKKWPYNETVYQLFMDFKKAYNSVRKEIWYNILKILLSKLEFYGVSGPMHELIASYLTGRFQRIKLQVNDWSEYLFKLGLSITWCPTGIHTGSPVILNLHQ